MGEDESADENGTSESDSADTTTETTESGGESVCGDGVKQGSEECDGNDLGGLSCLDYGHDNGTLICGDDCTIFDGACSTCGDNQLAATEACDGSNFGGLTCTDLGYAGGSLTCAEDCSQFFEDGCTVAQTCGNGSIDPGEQCDGGNLNNQTCAGLGFTSGTLGCTAGCVFDTSGCTVDEDMCVPFFGECTLSIFLEHDCCPGLTCALAICVPEN